ncbi:MAG: DUF928 domain-containing protein [Cyanobacteria bacterium P01_A01_bin.83]
MKLKAHGAFARARGCGSYTGQGGAYKGRSKATTTAPCECPEYSQGHSRPLVAAFMPPGQRVATKTLAPCLDLAARNASHCQSSSTTFLQDARSAICATRCQAIETSSPSDDNRAMRRSQKTLTIAIFCLLLPSILVPERSLAIEQQGVSSWKPINLIFAKKQTPKKREQPDALDFSGTGRPGQQTAGESRGSCANASNFQALLPVSRTGKTVLKHPRFWVYFPEALTQKSQVEFVVQNEAREDVWRSRLQLDREPGYKSFTLPNTAAPLEIGQWYRWYVKIYCDSQVASAQYVQGWVSRIPLNSQLHLELIDNPQGHHLIYGNHRIWYDAVDQLLSNYQSNPLNLSLEQDWQNLIGAIGVDLQGLPSIGGSYEAVDPTQINHQMTK